MYHETEMILSWHMHEYAHAPSIINVWIKYGYSRLYIYMYGNTETDQITKTWCKLYKSIDYEKKRSWSGDTCPTDMYLPGSLCGQNMASLDCRVTDWENWPKHENLM